MKNLLPFSVIVRNNVAYLTREKNRAQNDDVRIVVAESYESHESVEVMQAIANAYNFHDAQHEMLGNMIEKLIFMFEQMTKCRWHDDEGHMAKTNASIQELAKLLSEAFKMHLAINSANGAATDGGLYSRMGRALRFAQIQNEIPETVTYDNKSTGKRESYFNGELVCLWDNAFFKDSPHGTFPDIPAGWQRVGHLLEIIW